MKKDENIVELEKFVEDRLEEQNKQEETVDNIADKIGESLDELGKIMGRAFEAKRKVFTKGYILGLAVGSVATMAGVLIADTMNKKKK